MNKVPVILKKHKFSIVYSVSRLQKWRCWELLHTDHLGDYRAYAIILSLIIYQKGRIKFTIQFFSIYWKFFLIYTRQSCKSWPVRENYDEKKNFHWIHSPINDTTFCEKEISFLNQYLIVISLEELPSSVWIQTPYYLHSVANHSNLLFFALLLHFRCILIQCLCLQFTILDT